MQKPDPEKEIGFAAAESFTAKTTNLLARSGKTLRDTFGTLINGESIMFVSGGRWSAHELRAYILQQTGPAAVWMSTWAMSEESARMILTGIQTGLITELNGIFDRRLPVRKPAIMQLAQQMCTRISLVDCHAKVTVILNDTWGVTIIGSANDTNNKRIEAGVIITDRSAAEFNASWMLAQLEGGDPFNWKK